MTTEPNKKPILTAVAFIEPIQIDGRRFDCVIPSNHDYAHLSLAESPGFVIVTSTKSPDKLTKVPLANVKWLQASRLP